MKEKNKMEGESKLRGPSPAGHYDSAAWAMKDKTSAQLETYIGFVCNSVTMVLGESE